MKMILKPSVRWMAAVFWIAAVESSWGAVAVTPPVLINEIHHSPDVETEAVEFIELHNPGDAVVDLSGWSISGGIEFMIPPGTTIAAGGYRVLAQNPAALRSKFGTDALGPWIGRLEGHGDSVRLRDAAGAVVNEVEFQLGFPWPTVGDPPGYSIELIHPSLDNSLGGSWRASASGGATSHSQTLVPSGATWQFRKGTSESSAPATAWRLRNFDDSAWTTGAAPIGYDPSVAITTPLSDMNGNYTSVFLRRSFTVASPADITSLMLEALYDDGFKVWINGVNVLSRNVAAGEVGFDGTSLSTRENADWETNALPPPASYLVAGVNVIAVQLHNTLLSGSSDCFLDLRLLANTGPRTRGPTPGARNSVFANSAPPQIRQVAHTPEQPVSGQPVSVTAKVTDPDGVAGVTLHYQVVDPGNYIERTDPAYEANWISLPMNDAGTNGDILAADGIFTARLEAAVSAHRRLVRYRITATDAGGRAITAPYPDDPQPNFAFFVYDGVPAWQGALRPGSTDATLGAKVTYETNIMRRLPVYHLIARKTAVEQATWREKYTGDLYKWQGTLVYDGRVYDHIRYRARGGVWRYAMGKNMWKFDFNRGHDFEPRDNYRRKYKTPWAKLNLGACIQQGDYGHRGEQGLFESVGFALFNLAGVESPKTHFVQFRIIDDVAESDPANQFAGDFWGLYLAIEQEDGRFLDEHDLPDGNLYKMEGGTGTLNNQGATAASDRSDLDRFIGTYRGATPPSDLWWRTNLDLQRYYGYRAIVEGIHHYDIDESAGKNYFFYLNPETGRWSTHAWDLDLTWADSMFGGGNEPFKSRVLAGTRADFRIEYANRIRELRDLLFNSDQAFQLIDEYAAVLRDPETPAPTFLDADRAMWDFNPVMTNTSIINPSKAGHGRFYQAATTKNFNGMVAKMKSYVTFRGTQALDQLAADTAIPSQPNISYAGPANFPVNRLSFHVSAYAGANAFAAMRWRLAEITPGDRPAFDPAQPRAYEIQADWESGDLTTFVAEINLPPNVARPGRTYRARVQMRDATGRTSRWSAPAEFFAGESDTATALVRDLRVSELQYTGEYDREYLELFNAGPASLDLSGAKFTDGIDFIFPSGSSLAAGAYALVVSATNLNHFAAFRAAYQLDAATPVFGPFGGRFNNVGERVTLKTSAGGAEIFSFDFRYGTGWPQLQNDSGAESIHLRAPALTPAEGANWVAATPSPGRGGSVSLDSDGDGMSDAWEIANGFDPRAAADAALDADGDGQTNLQEHRAGTDPRRPAEVLRIEGARRDGGNLVIAFRAAAGRSCVLEFQDKIGAPWQRAAAALAGEELRSISVPLPPNALGSARFFRVRTE